MITSAFFENISGNSTRVAFDDHVVKSPPVTMWPDLVLEYVGARQWDELAGNFADIIPEQMASFNSGHWGEKNVEFLIFRQNQEIVGGTVMIVREIPLIKTGIALLKWGPVCRKAGNDFDAHLYQRIIACLQEEYCKKRNLHLTIIPAAIPQSAEKCQDILRETGFEPGKGFAAPERYIVNVQSCAQTLMASLDQKWRYNLRKSLKNDFEIKIADPETGLNDFLELYSKMIDRKKFYDSSAIDALEKAVNDSPDAIRPVIVLVSHEGKLTAGGIFHIAGNMASYMFGATDDRALKLNAGFALHWWVAEYLCNNKYIDWYDLGGNDRNRGLHQFKKGFVGKSGHILLSPPRFHYATSIPAKFIGFLAYHVRDIVSSVRQKLHLLKTHG